MADEEKEKKEEKKSKKGMSPVLKWIIVLFAVVILGAAGFAGWKYYEINFSSSKKAADEQEEQIVQEPGLWSMESQIVNLMDNNGERYLKTTIQIEVSSKDCLSELDLVKPKILDSILGLLSSKKYKEIAGFEGKQRLKDEIAVRLNGYLTKGQIRRVYFTEFLIQ
ncbi:MAG: flagellar basal body protein FliL [Deltaproteobacteria bacterium]|nr:MAG: flagellar basal body protein FliL [Deltaproteobacteria bacterium]